MPYPDLLQPGGLHRQADEHAMQQKSRSGNARVQCFIRRSSLEITDFFLIGNEPAHPAASVPARWLDQPASL
jgi:hypothetical protein